MWKGAAEMQLETLRYLVAVEEYGSTRRASENLNTSYQNVSRVLRQAEEELGAALFVRTSKGMVPTDEGRLAVDSAREMLKIYDRMLEQFQFRAEDKAHDRGRNISGKLELASSIAVSNGFINDLLLEFSSQYPKIRVKTSEEDAYLPVSEDRGQLYFVPRMTKDVYNSPYLTIPLLKDRMVMLVKKDSALNKQHSVSLKRIAKLPMVLVAKDNWEESIFGHILKEHDALPENPIFISSVIGFQKYVASGQYAGLSTEIIACKLMSDKRKTCEIIPIRDKDIEIYHCLVIRQPEALSRVEQCFVDFIKEYFHIT